jgi:hypothetical protein
MKSGLSPLWAAIGAVTAFIGGSVLIAVVWDVKHLLWGAVLLLVIILAVFIEGAYRQSRRAEAEHSAALASAQRELGNARAERDAVRDEMERRFSALRHALECTEVEADTKLRGDDRTYGDAEARLVLRNNSATDDLRWEIEEVTVVVEDLRSAAEDPMPSRGILVARNSVFIRCPLVHDVRLGWQSGSVRFTVRYGHPAGRLRFRKAQTYELGTSHFQTFPPQASRRLVSDPEVEDI